MNNETVTYTVDNDANIHGTSKKLTIKASYHKLVDMFGEPANIANEGDHARVQWTITFSDGDVLCVYDWNESVPVEEVTMWNVAGHSFMGASRIYDILAGKEIVA